MEKAISNLDMLLQSMQPELHSGSYYFTTLPKLSPVPLDKIIATIWEKEGLSVIVSEETAKEYGLICQFKSAWITLNVHSDLAAIGLTAAFSTALGNLGISCNVVAGNYHDHIFVPYEQRELALKTLLDLQKAKKHI